MHRSILGKVFCSCKTFIHYIPVNKGRLKSQALCDKAALAAYMAYVDSNPIRAKMATTPESSDHTSIKRRIKAAKNNKPVENIAQFAGNPRQSMPQGLPFKLRDYIELVDWTGRVIRDGAKGQIGSAEPPIIERLGIEPNNWLQLTQAFEKNTKTFVGADAHIVNAAQQLGYRRTPHRQSCRTLFG